MSRGTGPASPKKTPAQIRADSVEKAESSAGLKPYAKVVTKEARTRSGLFITHRLGDTLLFEIPRREFGRDMLLVGRFAKASGGTSFGGDEFTERVLRWERQGNRVLLRSMTFELTADSTLPVYHAVSQASYPPVVAVFKVEAYGPDSSAVIDVTSLYTTNVPEFTGARGSFDDKRSFIERVAAFPENIEVEATQTFTPENPPDSPRGPGPIPAQSVLAHWSMIRLSAKPMLPRLADKRVGFFEVRQTDFGTAEHRSVTRSYITRWRLEKQFPDSALSAPVKPIVYYIDPATPAQWIPWIRKGIEDWQPAFEAAGFREAIIAKEAPPPSEDPDWSPEDIRNTLVRWLAINDRKRRGASRSRPAQWRNSERLHSRSSQRAEPRAQLVLHAGCPARLACAASSFPRLAHGADSRVCRGTRSRPHAWLSTQHESKFHLSRRQFEKCLVAATHGTYANTDGLCALQLRRAA